MLETKGMGVILLSMTLWVGCQPSDVANPDSKDAGSLASGVKSMGKPAKVSPAGDHWLGESATCKDKGPADFGIAFKCTDASDPVCGCDGKTYVNYCVAWGVSGMNVEHKGACAGDPVVDPNPVEPPHVGAPTCNDPPPDQNIQVKCTNESHPVCGCDGKTYVNGCQAFGIGHVNVDHQGACAATPIHYIK